ncbi:MAG: GDSL-type esterase/lipase family protein [Dehalococcoidia bacterium]
MDEAREWLVLGHSGTRGEGLDGAPPWPVLLEALLAAHGVPARIAAIDLFPNGAKAADFALRKVVESRPDAVLVSLNAFPCAVPVVSREVRERFGERAGSVYAKVERAWQRHTAERRAPAAIERTVRMIAHRAVGARPMLTVAAAAEAYVLVLERLTALEGPRPVVIGEVPFSAALRRRHPRAMARVRELQALVRPVAESRHIDWIDLGEELAGTPDGDLWQTDGVHLSARGNELYAAALARRLRD